VTHRCRNCHESPLFSGFDECLPCGVAILRHEQPEYLAWAQRVYAQDVEWLAQLNAEWQRQSPTPTYTEGFMTRRQA
jgi:hypothetical protein